MTIVAKESLIRNATVMKSLARSVMETLDVFIVERVWSQDELERLDDVLLLLGTMEAFATEAGSLLKEQC